MGQAAKPAADIARSSRRQYNCRADAIVRLPSSFGWWVPGWCPVGVFLVSRIKSEKKRGRGGLQDDAEKRRGAKHHHKPQNQRNNATHLMLEFLCGLLFCYSTPCRPADTAQEQRNKVAIHIFVCAATCLAGPEALLVRLGIFLCCLLRTCRLDQKGPGL